MMSQLITSVAILVVLLGSPSVFGQSQTSDVKPRHCSVEKYSRDLPYPDSLKGSGIQGIVLVEAIIGEDGCTRSVGVVRKLHPKLDQVAKDTVDSWKFLPAKKDGKPVAVKIQIEVNFKDGA
jgi:TonB family protein